MNIDPARFRDFAVRYTEAWCSRNPESVAAFFSTDGSLKVNDDAPAVGRRAIAEVARSFMTAFPDLRILMDDLILEVDRPRYHWTLIGTNASSGRKVRVSGFESWQFGEDGLITESLGHFDSADYQRQLLAQLELIPATAEQQPIVANLLELYAHDFSEFRRLELGSDGKFGYEPLPLYWTEPGRHPFLVKMDGRLAGLVLVKHVSGKQPIWDMAEFFIVRGYRRLGIGTEVAHQVWRRLAGQWQVRVLPSNPARYFWERAIAEFTRAAAQPAAIEKSGETWFVFSFESKPGA